MLKRAKVLSAVLASAVAVSTAAAGYYPQQVYAAAAAQNQSQKIQAEFYVSPEGDDLEGDGCYDTPFASLEAARDAVRKINQDMTGDIIVFIAAGQYYMNKTVVFDERDSGTNGYQIRYQNLDGLASAELIGGSQVTSAWNLVERTGADSDLPASAEGHVYKTHVGTGNIFDTLYVNDRRATLARTQNRATYEGFVSALTPYMRSAGGGVGELMYKAGDLDSDAVNGLVNAQAREDLDASVYMWDGGYWDWMTDTIPVSAIDTGNSQLDFKKVDGHPEMYRPKYATRENARYFLQGNLGFLDTAGEYYFNKTTGNLYYYPEGTMEDQDVVIPQIREIIRVEGQSKDSMVENLTFSGLQLKDTNTADWYTYGWNWGDAGDGLGFYPQEAEGSTQPSYCEQSERIDFQFGNITLVNTKNITITKSHLKNSGMFGINIYLANQNTEISDCLIEYTGHGGINVEGGYPGVAGDENGDGYSRDNLITNCVIHDIGELIGQASGLTVQQSSYNTFSHLEVYNSPRRGIFLTAGNSRNGGTPFPDGDKDYSPMRDMYSHHNTFEYCYIHDCQQDGGDDGAFFACYLYKGGQYKPNYINQMLIDSIGANPTMTDLSPNGMNLDMGCSGIELNNVKSTNPMNFNMEVNTILQYNDEITFNNTNIDYGTLKNQINDFDDSLMEYDQIGVTSDFPAEYDQMQAPPEEPEDLWFQEDFEQDINLSKWAFRGTEPRITTQWISEGPMAGRQGLEVSGNSVLYREFKDKVNKIITVDMFDRQNNNLASYDSGRQNSAKATSFASAGTEELKVGLGLLKDEMNTYAIQAGGERISSGVERTFGWHRFTFDFSSGTEVKLYIDDRQVGAYPAEGIEILELGSDDGEGIVYYDQVKIYGGETAEEPGQVPLPQPPEYDPSNDNIEILNLDFQEGEMPGFVPNGNNEPLEIVQESSENLVLKQAINDGKQNYELGADWTNYALSYWWKFEGWGSNNVLNQQYDNFTTYVMTSGKEGNPDAYQVVYRRNKNGADGFPAGTPYFEIMKHQNSDVSLGRKALPEDFDPSEWHEVMIQTFGGNVGFVLDGQKMLSVLDGSLRKGGISFGGINSTVLLDDIKIISNPTNVAYDSNLGLENAELNGIFNPEHYLYQAFVEEENQPVVLTRPEVILDGVELKVELNGNELEFDDNNQVRLELQQGVNSLTITEYTVAAEKIYTVYIGEKEKIVSVEPISAVTIRQGERPKLQSTVNVVFEDGTEKELPIVWRMVYPPFYKSLGDFTVKGGIEGYDYYVFADVSVNGITSISELPDIITEPGQIPALPSAVTAIFTDGERALPLSFPETGSDLYQAGRTVVLPGLAEGYKGELKQRILVSGEPEQPEGGIRALLRQSYEYALTLSTEGVTEAAVEQFEAAMQDAMEVLDDKTIPEERVNEVLNKLLKAIWGLGVVQGDKTNLRILVKMAETMLEDEGKYVAKYWSQLNDALQAAQNTLEDGNALEEQVRTAADTLLQAILAQRYKADKSNLQEIIDQANAIDLYLYTDKTAEDVKLALVAANAVMEDEDLSINEQQVVDDARVELDGAIKALKLKNNDGNDGTGGGNKPGNPGGNKNAGGAGGTGKPGRISKSGSPKTGDPGSAGVVVVMTASLAGAYVLIRRRRARK